MTRQMTMPTVPQKNAAVRSGAAIPAGQGYTFKDITGILRRRIWLITLLTGLIAFGGMSLWAYLKKNSPSYTAANFIRCEMPQNESVYTYTRTVDARPEVIALITAQHANALTNEAFLNKLLTESVDLQKTAWYGSLDPGKRVREFKKAFNASPVRNSKLVRLSMTASSASDVKKILDIILDSYKNDVETEATGNLKSERIRLVSQKGKLETAIASINNAIVSLKSSGIGVGNVGMTTAAQEMMRYNAGMLEQTEILTELKKGLAELELEKQNGEMSLSAALAAESDPAIYNLKNQITNYNQQLQSLIERGCGDEHNEVKTITAMILLAKKQIEKQRFDLIERYSEQQEQTYRRQIAATQEILDEITSMYAKAEMRQSKIEKDNVSYMASMQEKDQKNEQLSAVEKRISDLDIQIDNNRSNVVFPLPTMEPDALSFPLLKIFLPGSMMLGLMLSVGLAFLLEMLDDAVRSPVDVSRHLNAPSLGMIPLYDQDEAGSVCVEKITMTHPSALMSEFYRQARTNLDFSSPAGELKTMLFTSSSSGDGKTCSAVNMAITYATEGKKILLIDANFRRPKVGKLFENAAGMGLSRALVGQASVAEVIGKTDVPNLDIIDSGPLPPNPADLLSSNAMKQLLESQQEKYDLIIIDGPPALVVVDARIMSGIVDGTVVVVDAGKTTRGMGQRMLREINQSGGKVLGVLLNGVKPRKGGYFEKAYKSYYDYAQQEQA
ncbi:MAG: polysaccharide biosynthesis tyrosine autokinase [Phycisphaerae bacterium]|nr:polysaccharide biosynthesis tyrosine autokinase [Phycisphaerae bacterium]